ncbi:MAG: divalent-cation tolerance protein CutA [Pelagibacteraceae bacterium]
MSNYKLLYVTCKNSSEAKKIGSILVKSKLAACTNILANINSIFNWKNKISNCKETILLGKTVKKNIFKIIKIVKKNHSYDCPCIIFFDINAGNKKFLDWINKNT